MAEQDPLGTTAEGGPLSSKATAASLGATVATLFWTIAAMTFADDWDAADVATLTTLTTVLVSGLLGFYVPERPRYTAFSDQWHDAKRRRRETHGNAADALTTARRNTQHVQALEDQFQALQGELARLTNQMGQLNGSVNSGAAPTAQRR